MVDDEVKKDQDSELIMKWAKPLGELKYNEIVTECGGETTTYTRDVKNDTLYESFNWDPTDKKATFYRTCVLNINVARRNQSTRSRTVGTSDL